MPRLLTIILSALVGLIVATGEVVDAHEGHDPPGEERTASVDIWIANTGTVYALPVP